MTTGDPALRDVTCVTCGGARSRPIHTKFGMHIVECPGCGLRFVSPRHDREVVWQRYSADYFLKEYLPSQRALFGGRLNPDALTKDYGATLDLLESQLGGPGRLLDVGAGAGLFVAAARQRRWKATGVELSETAVKFGRDVLGVDLHAGTAESIAAIEERFDAVTMFDVIEHLYDPVSVLRAARSILRPGGVVMISTPNYDALSRWALGADWAILSPLEHLYYFSGRSLTAALRAAGFTAPSIHQRHRGWGLFETMNPDHTHARRSLRALAYKALVLSAFGWFGLVQRAGRGDTLLATARA
jgi:2-polyprenyl-3-methyl-5-hydroxy-6-metoxy-1,4-benzoquinol methylase